MTSPCFKMHEHWASSLYQDTDATFYLESIQSQAQKLISFKSAKQLPPKSAAGVGVKDRKLKPQKP